jgi:hypothetical protein
VRIEDKRDSSDAGRDLLEKLEPFSAHADFEIRESGHVAAWSCQIRHYAAGDWIKHEREYDRYRAGRLLQRARGRRAVCEQQVRRERDQFRSLRVEGLAVSDRVAIIDVEVATDDPTEISKRLNDDRVTVLRFRILLRQTHQPADPPHSIVLLRSRR